MGLSLSGHSFMTGHDYIAACALMLNTSIVSRAPGDICHVKYGLEEDVVTFEKCLYWMRYSSCTLPLEPDVVLYFSVDAAPHLSYLPELIVSLLSDTDFLNNNGFTFMLWPPL